MMDGFVQISRRMGISGGRLLSAKSSRKGDFLWLFLVSLTGVDQSGGESDHLREVGPDER
jgi:hypothetical protein